MTPTDSTDVRDIASFSRSDIPRRQIVAQSRFPVRADCPTCGDLMHVTRLECDTCGTAVEGNFFLHSINRLPGDSLAPSMRTGL